MEENPYESSKLLGEYLLFHYGRKEEILPWSNGPVEALNFCSRSVESLMVGPDEFEPNKKALDIGCAVGAATFVLGKYFGKVVGVDFSKNFIEAANKLKKERFIDYHYQKLDNISDLTLTQYKKWLNLFKIKTLENQGFV